MQLREWLEADPARTLQDLARKADVTYATAHKAKSGVPVKYEIAKALSEATGGDVGVVDLCEGTAEGREKRAARRAASSDPDRVHDPDDGQIDLPRRAGAGR